MNKVILIGRLTKDVETRENSTVKVSRYTLAVDRRFKKEGEATADFINCIAFANNADFAEKYLRKGTKIAVTGRIQISSYEKNGQKIYTTDVVIEEQEFAESKAKDETPKANAAAYTKPQMPVDLDGFMQISDDISEELPFA